MGWWQVRETHQELGTSKIIFGDGATSFGAHSTHVTGTICAKDSLLELEVLPTMQWRILILGQ
jgi:hypothetical protein